MKNGLTSTIRLLCLSVLLLGSMAVTAMLVPDTSLDVDRDGLDARQEALLGTNRLTADTDGDGMNDKLDAKPCIQDNIQAFSDTSQMSAWVCLASAKGAEMVCFSLNEAVLFELSDFGTTVILWDESERHVRASLAQIDAIVKQRMPGYSHFYPVSRQDLANMIYADCLDKPRSTLWFEVNGDRIWATVSRDKLPEVESRVPLCQ